MIDEVFTIPLEGVMYLCYRVKGKPYNFPLSNEQEMGIAKSEYNDNFLRKLANEHYAGMATSN